MFCDDLGDGAAAVGALYSVRLVGARVLCRWFPNFEGFGFVCSWFCMRRGGSIAPRVECIAVLLLQLLGLRAHLVSDLLYCINCKVGVRVQLVSEASDRGREVLDL